MYTLPDNRTRLRETFLAAVCRVSEVHHLTYAFPAVGLASVTAESASRAPLRLIGVAASWLLLVGGRIDREGPYFFLALCLLGGLVSAEVLGRPATRDT